MHSKLCETFGVFHILKIKRWVGSVWKIGIFLTIKVVKKKKLIVINYVFGITHNKRLTNFFKRCHRVNKNSPNKKFTEMSLSSSGRMLKSYFSCQQRRSRSSLFDTSTSFCRSRSRNRRACLRSLIWKRSQAHTTASASLSV